MLTGGVINITETLKNLHEGDALQWCGTASKSLLSVLTCDI